MVGNVNWFIVLMMVWFLCNWVFVERMMVLEFLYYDYGVVLLEFRVYFKVVIMLFVDMVIFIGWCIKYILLC